MASNEHDPDGVAGPARGKRRAQDHAFAFGDDWVTPSAPQPKKNAAPPPPVSVHTPRYAGKRLVSRVLGPRPPRSTHPQSLLSGPAGGHRTQRAPHGLSRARGRPHALGRPGRPVRLTVPEPWGVGVFGAERTTSARHGGSCSTHDEWWAVCPPQTGSPRPPPPPVSVPPLSVTHNRRPEQSFSP